MSSEVVRSPHTAFGAGRSINWLLEARARDRPGQTFFFWEPFEGEGCAWTYRDFAEAVARAAGGLRRSGVKRGTRVLIHLDNRPEYLIAWFACARLGAVAVCTNTQSAQDELKYYVEHSGVEFAITQSSYLPVLTHVFPAAKEIWTAGNPGTAEINAFDALLRNDPVDAEPVPALAPIVIQYTSGTTGRPKGVVLTHANQLWGAKVNAVHESLTAADVQLVYLPLFHINAQAYSVLPTMWMGGTFVLQPRFSASRFWPVSIRHKCTWASMIYFGLNVLNTQAVPKHFYRLWATGMSGHPLESRFGVPMIGWWGMTETVSHPIIGDVHVPNRPRSIGRPAPEYQVAVVRPDGSGVEPGETGEILVRGTPGVSLFAEYLHDPAATTAAFDDQGWFKSGDLATVHEDGSISFADRAKDMLKVGAENVAASEIERIILSVPGVKEAAVVAAPHPILVEVPVAFVVTTADQPDLEEAVISACRDRLANFKVPKAVYIVPDLPRATLGKVAKHKLRERLREQSSEP